MEEKREREKKNPVHSIIKMASDFSVAILENTIQSRYS